MCVRAIVQPRPALGYIMVAVAATPFAVNGTVSKVILGSGIGSGELTEVRCAVAVVGLALIPAITRPSSLRAQQGDPSPARRTRSSPSQ